MYLFHNDYNQMCHPDVLKKMQFFQSEQYDGYGMDVHCKNAARLIRQHCGTNDLDVHFLVGGTQTNLIVAAAALRPYQAVITADTGHVNVHETGAIEATGHKLVALPSSDGKLTAVQVERLLAAQSTDPNAEHAVQCKMVYISNPTELGTTYSLSELTALSNVCKQYGLYLFLDGARLGYALAACGNDITLSDYARLCDVFYIGGTKCGAMFGEAVIIKNLTIARDFRYMMKQRGGMLAKGWLLGLQFEALFEDDLYLRAAAHANQMANQLRNVFQQHNIPLFLPGSTNQIFPILPNDVLDELSQAFTYLIQQDVDANHKAVRFCTSWATTQESIDALSLALERHL